MKARNIRIGAAVLFADLRGCTAAVQSLASSEMNATLDAFYDECAEAIWQHDGLLNKTLGDAVMAVFNFPLRQEDHAAQALRAARQMPRQRRARRPGTGKGPDGAGAGPRIGVGLSRGQSRFG